MKPILFNTDMVRAILDRRKTVTRRVVKPQPYADERKTMANTQPYRPADILYVRETWAKIDGEYVFRADDEMPEGWHLTAWHPSIHMPRVSARIFLRMTDMSVQRVQEVTEEDARKEGCADRKDFHGVWNACYAMLRPVKGEGGVITHYESYPWEDIRETRTYRGQPWYVIGNPWVWVISFERISREEAIT